MQQLRDGVWHWQTRHPDWNDEQWWPPEVSSYAIEVGDGLLLIVRALTGESAFA